MTLWMRGGKLLVDAGGHPIDCPHCPCEPAPSGSGCSSQCHDLCNDACSTCWPAQTTIDLGTDWVIPGAGGCSQATCENLVKGKVFVEGSIGAAQPCFHRISGDFQCNVILNLLYRSVRGGSPLSVTGISNCSGGGVIVVPDDAWYLVVTIETLLYQAWYAVYRSVDCTIRASEMYQLVTSGGSNGKCDPTTFPDEIEVTHP